jgi:proton-dependent oligopeptide transporter, POT family
MDAGLKLIIVAWSAVAVWITLIIFSQRKYHPKALFILFFAEMWERFSFYGMRALLILYLSKELFSKMDQGLADSRSYGIYGAYNALLYAAPVLGGLLADRILGFRFAILIGGIVMALGQFTLASTIGNQVFFFIGLAMIAVGNGFFKPNISSFLGTFYDQNDPKKDSAFTIFYMGINVGAFLAPVTCGYLGEKIDWSFGFLAAGIGMILGLIVFWRNMRIYTSKGNPPVDSKLRSYSSFGIPGFWLVIGGIILAIPVFALLIDVEKITSYILVAAGIFCITYLLWVAYLTENKYDGRKLIVIVILFFFHMIFWALYEQAGGSINILTDRYINRHGIETSQFQAVPAMFIVLLAPLFSWIWVKLRKVKLDPYTPVKFFWSLLSMSIAYLVLVIGARSVIGTDKLIPLIFLLIMYLFHTTGELSISPVGLSVVTKLSPAKIAGFVMGLWFLSIALGHKIAGFLGQLIAIPGNQGNKTTELKAFMNVYMTWGVYVVLGSALLILALTPLLRKWMSNIH